jgi:hypothetical protein
MTARCGSIRAIASCGDLDWIEKALSHRARNLIRESSDRVWIEPVVAAKIENLFTFALHLRGSPRLERRNRKLALFVFTKLASEPPDKNQRAHSVSCLDMLMIRIRKLAESSPRNRTREEGPSRKGGQLGDWRNKQYELRN